MLHHAAGIGPGSGHGRPPALPAVPGTIITYRLLLQLGMLRYQMQMTWVWLYDCVHKLLPQCFEVLPRLNHLILKTEKKVPGTCSRGSVDEIAAFLSAERDFTHLPNTPFCTKYGVTWAFLLENEDCILPASDEMVPNGLVIELDKFRTENYLSGPSIQSWLHIICPSFQLSTKELLQKISLLKVKHKKHLKARARRPEDLRTFLEEAFAPMQKQLESITGASHLSPSLTTSSPPNTVASCSNHCTSELERMKRDNQRLTSEIQQQDGQLQHHRDELEGMKEICLNQHATVSHLNKSLTETREDLKWTVVSLQVKEQKLAEKTKTCTVFARNANNVKASKSAIDRLRGEMHRDQQELKITIERKVLLEEDNRSIQRNFEKTKAKAAGLRKRCRDQRDEIRQLEEEVTQPQLRKQLKDDQGKYTDEVKTCVIQLMGESDVSAAKVGKVIQTVTSHLTGNKLELAELPSKTTALHFADIGHALTKFQIFNEITSQRFDLHLDGTSRDHKKVVGHQVTLQDRRQLSLGFTPVDREDSKTLVDVTMNLFYEIASVMTACG